MSAFSTELHRMMIGVGIYEAEKRKEQEAYERMRSAKAAKHQKTPTGQAATQREAALLEAVRHFGRGRTIQIARRAGVNRTTAVPALGKMAAKGIVRLCAGEFQEWEAI